MRRKPVTLALALVIAAAPTFAQTSDQPVRSRSLGAAFDGLPGPFNAITDVPGVLVGHTTVVEGEGKHAVRTGVAAVLPRRELGYYPAATFVLNCDAEVSGAIFAEEFGMLRSPIMLTGTASNGTVFTSVIKWSFDRHPQRPIHMPVVTDTWDADLSDAFAFPLTDAHVRTALDGARTGPVTEGSVGGGTGMICFEFKGGIGTASRRVTSKEASYTVGVLVQCNQAARADLLVSGRPVGKALADLPIRWPDPEVRGPEKAGSIIIVVGTDAPLAPSTLKAVAKRAALGLARTGGNASAFSGDVVIAFSTARLDYDKQTFKNQAEPTLKGRGGSVAYALPHDRLRKLLSR